MITTLKVFTFANMGLNETLGVFLHGFQESEFVSYCITPWSRHNPGITPRAELRIGPVQLHVDGTYAREAYVTNQTISHEGNPRIYVDLIALISTREDFR